MASDMAAAEIELFYNYLGRRIADDGGDITPEDSVQEFRAYQAELQRFVEETHHAEQQSNNGEAKPLDLEALKQRVDSRVESRD